MKKNRENLEQQEEDLVEEVNNTVDETSTEPENTEEVENECDKLAAELAVWQDKYARLSAEFDNYRKRTLKEKMELVEGGSEKAVLAVLPVVDDLERAIANIPDENQRQGVELVMKKMMDSLRSLSVEMIESLGQELDVEVHNAIAKFPTDDPEKKGKIIDVVKNGYRLGQKVIRHAEVVIGE